MVCSLFGGRNRGISPGPGHRPRGLRSRFVLLLLTGAILAPATAGPARADEVSRKACVECHGDGVKPPATPDTPVLAGQPELYVLYQLVYFRQGQRKHEVMNELMREMSDDDLRGLAAWVGSLPSPEPASKGEPGPGFARGQAMARKHLCGNCHEPDLSGREHMPRLAGQQEQYLLKALQDFKAGRRVGIQAAMAEVLSAFDEPDLEDLAHYMAYAGSQR